MTILKHKVYNILEAQQPEKQAGFHKNYSTIDHIQTLNQILEKSKEYQIKIEIMFVDFNKAFDSLYHNEIWITFAKQGIAQKIMEILSNIYSKSEVQIRLDKVGEKFQVRRGVKQGDPLSPNIFNAVLEEVFRHLDWREQGLKIKDLNLNTIKNLNNLRFADDIAIISKTAKELKEMVEDLKRESAKVGLSVNFSKTKIITNTNKFESFKIEHNEMEVVHEYRYLGQIMSFEKKMEKELKVRKANAWKAFWAQKTILKGKMNLRSKIRILERTVYPVITCRAQVWACTKKQIMKMKTTQHSMLRNILGIRLKDKRSIQDIKNITKTKNIGEKIKKLKFSYADHLTRALNSKWNKITTLWTPIEKKRRGQTTNQVGGRNWQSGGP